MYKIITITLIVFIITSCNQEAKEVEEFSLNELEWFNPFNKTDTVIFFSEQNEFDTIIFHKSVADRDSTSGYEQGNTKTNYSTVYYEFTKGSYHQFALMSDGKTKYSQHLLNMLKSSSVSSNDSYYDLEIVFIGTIFSDEELNEIEKIGENTFYFETDKATDNWINVEKGIKDFTLNTEIGITSYTDDRGYNWKRKN